jgi:hypothetical protein
VSILISADLAACLSPTVAARVRRIDTVLVKGSAEPMGLYAYDVCLDHIQSGSGGR